METAPMIYRKRLVIEGTRPWPIVEDQIIRYLRTRLRENPRSPAARST